MASEVGSIYVSLTADLGPFGRNMTTAGRITDRTADVIRRAVGEAEKAVGGLSSAFKQPVKADGLRQIESSIGGITSSLSGLRGTIGNVTALFGGLAATLSVQGVVRYADAYTSLSNQVRVTAKDSADLQARLRGIGQAAEASRSGLTETAVLFSRISKAQPNLNSDEVLKYVTTIQQGLQLGGATAQEAASAAIQFSQALASGRLNGEELRAILETPLGQALADGLDVSIGKLKQMGADGELTVDRILKALDKVSPRIQQQFGASTKTVSQSLTDLNNKFTTYVGQVDQAYGVTQTITGGIGALANNLDTLVPLVSKVGALIAAAFAGKVLSAIARNSPVATIINGMKQAKQEAEDLLKIQQELVKERQGLVNQAAVTGTSSPQNFVNKAELKEEAQLKAQIAKIDAERGKAVALVAAAEAKASKAAADLAAVEKEGATASAAARAKVTQTYEAQTLAVTNAKAKVAELDAAMAKANTTLQSVTARNIDFGTSNRANEVTKLNRAVAEYDKTLSAVSAQQIKATVAGTALAQVGGLISRGFGSLVAFLGGPLGVALTAAVAGFGYFGAKAAEAAQKSQAAAKIIEEEIGALASAGDKAAQQSQAELKLEAIGDRAKTAGEELAKLRQQANSLFSVTFDILPNATVDELAQARAEFERLVKQVKDGKITTADMATEIAKLARSNRLFAYMGEDLARLVPLIGNAERAMGSLKSKSEETAAAIKAGLGDKELFGPLDNNISKTLSKMETMSKLSEKIRRGNLEPIQTDFLDAYEAALKQFKDDGVAITDEIRKWAEGYAQMATMQKNNIRDQNLFFAKIGDTKALLQSFAGENPVSAMLTKAIGDAETLKQKLLEMQQELSKAQASVRDAAAAPVTPPGPNPESGMDYEAQLQALREYVAEVQRLASQIESGGVTTQQFALRLGEIRMQAQTLGLSGALDPYIANVLAAITKTDGLTTEVEQLRQKLLETQAAGAQVKSLIPAQSGVGAVSRVETQITGPDGITRTVMIDPSSIQNLSNSIVTPLNTQLATNNSQAQVLNSSVVSQLAALGIPLDSIRTNTDGTISAINQDTSTINTTLSSGFSTLTSAVSSSGSGSGSDSGEGGEKWTFALPSVLDQATAAFEMQMQTLTHQMQILQIQMMEAQLSGNEELVEALQQQMQVLQLQIAQLEITRPTRFNTPNWNMPSGTPSMGGLASKTGFSMGGFGPGFARGGSFEVGGIGGRDSQVVPMRVTPGERVTVETPEQQRHADAPARGDTIVNFNAPVPKQHRRAARQMARELRALAQGG